MIAVNASTELGILLSIITIGSILIGALVAIGRLLWNLSNKWTSATEQLTKLSDEIKTLVLRKEADHARIAEENLSLKRRFDAHEMWHAAHDPKFRKGK